MTLISDYVSQVQKEVDDTSNGALATIQQQVVDTYNEIIEECNQFLQGSLTEEYTTVLSQTAYPASKDVNIVHQIAYKPVSATNLRILQQITLEDYKNNFINRVPSIPTCWFYDGDVINIAPKPNETGTVRIVYTPNYENPAQADTSIIPARYFRTVIDGAIYRFKAWENNLVASQMYERQYLAGKRKMFLQLSTRSKTLSPKLYGRV
jgi:hypothetical protein